MAEKPELKFTFPPMTPGPQHTSYSLSCPLSKPQGEACLPCFLSSLRDLHVRAGGFLGHLEIKGNGDKKENGNNAATLSLALALWKGDWLG